MSKPLLKSEWEVMQEQLKSEKAVLKALEEHYKEALNTLNDRIAAMMGRGDANLPHVIRRIEYQKMVRAQVQAALDTLHGKEYETVSAYLQDTYTDAFVGTMYTLYHQDVPVIVPIDQNAVIKAVTIDSKVKDGVYTALGVDMTHLKKTIANEITRGIASGLLYDDITRNISNAAMIPMRRARTITRTEAGRVQEQASFDAAEKAKEAGADVVKQWSAVRDGKTRDSHRALDGQVRELNEPFSIGTHKAMHPHGFGLAEEDINCRCTMLTRARSALDEDDLKLMQERAEAAGLLVNDKNKKAFAEAKAKNFAEFKEKYLKAAENAHPIDFVPAKTKEEAEIFAKQSGVKYVEYGKLPLDTINEINKAVSTLPDDVRPVFVGDSNTLEQYFGGKLPRSSKNYYGVTINTFDGIHLGYGKGVDFDTDGYMVGISSSYKTVDKITLAKKRSQELYLKKHGRKYFFNETGKSTPYHEMGHVYEKVKGLPNGFENDAKRWAKESGCDMLNKASEAWAEAWGAYYTDNKDLPDYIAQYIEGASKLSKNLANSVKGLPIFDDDAIMKEEIETFTNKLLGGKIGTAISKQKQSRHIKGSKEFAAYAEKLAKRGDYPSYIKPEIGMEELADMVESKLGTGIVEVKKDKSFQEFFDCDEFVGYYYDKVEGMYKPTKRVQVKYAVGGGNIHIIPVKGR